MNKSASVIIGIIVIVLVGWFVYAQNNPSQSAPMIPASTTPSTDTTGTASSTATNTASSSANTVITAAEVAQHNDSSSCWSIINGNVYDLTSWIPQHPGGPQAIESICGIDGSAKFNKQHGGAALQAGILAGFKIGVAG